MVLYPVGQPAKRAVTLYLHKEDAQELADRLMPVRDPVCHRPAGGERAALVVLGANGLSTLALTYLAIRQSRPFPLTAEAVALSRLNVLVRFAAHWLPAGAAWMLVLTGALNALLGSRGGNWEILTASAFITIIVPLFVFFALQRYLVRGLLAGSVKGG